MFKKLLLFLIAVFSSVFLLATLAYCAPFYYYSRLVDGNYENEWYERSDNRELLKNPIGLSLNGDDFDMQESLWREFHLKDVVIPLPVKNPFFFVAPKFKYSKQKDVTRLSLSLQGSSALKLLEIVFNPNTLVPSVRNEQKMFELPIVSKMIDEYSSDKVWEDLFSKKIDAWNISYEQMIYNLYLLELRAKLIPKQTKSYYWLKEYNVSVIELESENKDYKKELVLNKDRGFIFSYFLITRLKSQESLKLRSFMLKNISFREGGEHLSKILYREFKALDYKDKVDHEGFLYLLSAFSHDMSSSDFIEEMVFHLERGKGNEDQLRPIYNYAKKRFNKTFSKKSVPSIKLDDELELYRKIEVSEKKARDELEKHSDQVESKARTKKEIFEDKLRQAKEESGLKVRRLFVD